MKALPLIALLIFSISTQAQTLGDRISEAQASVEDSPLSRTDQNLLLMEYYAKKSILESINVAQELNAAVGLENLSEDYTVAVPLLAVGALYTSLQTYRASDFTLKAIQRLASPSHIERFVREAADMESKITAMTQLESRATTRLRELEAQIDVLEKAQLEDIPVERIASNIQNLREQSHLLSPLLDEYRLSLRTLENNYLNHMTMISRKTLVRNAISVLGTTARGTLLVGSIAVGISIISDTVILMVPQEQLSLFKSQLEQDLIHLEAVL